MCRTGISPLLLLGITSLAGCSDRNTLTAPSADAVALSPSGFIGDRPYTWSFTCHGSWAIYASWSWTENGLAIASEVAGCGDDQTFSGTGVRPANANGFTAGVGTNSKSWTFDPAGPFNASLPGSVGDKNGHCLIYCIPKESGKLTVDS